MSTGEFIRERGGMKHFWNQPIGNTKGSSHQVWNKEINVGVRPREVESKLRLSKRKKTTGDRGLANQRFGKKTG